MRTEFEYIAYNQDGAKVEGSVAASSKDSALLQLSSQNLHPIKIKPKQDSSILTSLRGNGVSSSQIEHFTQEMAMLLASGVRVDKAISIISNSQDQTAFKKMLSDLGTAIKGGQSFSGALAKFDKHFNKLYINLVAIGESTGNLAEVFSALADDLSFKSALRRNILQSLMYPMVILGVCILCLYFVFKIIVPRMSNIFVNIEVLPWYTEMVLGLSNWLNRYEVFIVAAVFALVSILVWAKQKGKLSAWLYLSMQYLPLLTQVSVKVDSMRFNSSMGLMLRSGLILNKALPLAVDSMKNPTLQDEVRVVSSKIQKGHGLSESLSQTSIFSQYYRSLLEVGEASGDLATSFNEIAKRQRTQFEALLQRFTALLEPILIVFMGAIVGGVVIIMMMSMVAVNDVSL